MPGKKNKQNSRPPPQSVLKNIINVPSKQKKQFLSKCVVKIPKIDVENMNASVGKNRNLKRKSEDTKELNREVCLIKKPPDQPSASTNEPSVEKLIKKYEQLQKVISNKYLTVVERLKLDFVPFCAENVEHCHRNHYKKAPLPKFPTTTQMNLLQNSVQQSRYNIFINLVWDLCQKEQFPGDGVLTDIVKMLLTLNPERQHNKFLQSVLDQLLWLFDVILRVFPPCWLALRPIYMKFLRNTIPMSKLLQDKTLQAEFTIFEVVLQLLEDTIDDRENIRNSRRRYTNSNISLKHRDDEYYSLQHWEKQDNDEQTFSALSKATRLDRLMQVLHLIAKMLEMDLALWMLRYHKHPAEHIYSEEDQPLVITLFSLSKYARSSVLVKKVMSLFALCVEKNLDVHYLKILERFISLLGNIQNLCETEASSEGIRYPYVGPATTSFTMDLFKTTEVNMKKNMKTYMRLIKTLRCPFVCYEYIDLFLKRLNPDVGKMCPQKIVENFRKNRWLECQAEEEKTADGSYSTRESIVYRKDYLNLLLIALRNYCDLHGTKEFLREVQSTKTEAVSLSKKPQEMVVSSLNKNIDLSKMRKNIVKLEASGDMSMKFSQPRTAIPVVNIRVNSELFSQYRNDMKYVVILQKYIPALQREYATDFSELMEFLDDFGPK